MVLSMNKRIFDGVSFKIYLEVAPNFPESDLHSRELSFEVVVDKKINNLLSRVKIVFN